MADACAAPQRPAGPLRAPLDNLAAVPLWLPPGLAAPPEPVARLLAERIADAAHEDARLLYVAMTRAREILCVGGAARPTKKALIPPASWYARIEAALADWPLVEQPPAAWPGPVRVATSGVPAAIATAPVAPEAGLLLAGDWWQRPAPVESRPPRPLAPSALASDPAAAPPPSPQRRAAARRGSALHRLFELLPQVPPPLRAQTARTWCRLNVPDLDGDDLVATVMAVLDAPRYAALFAPDTLAEAPVSAVIGGSVIAGTIDRLAITADAVLALDFKTGARVPADAAALPLAHVAQMGAYAAALAAVFPGRTVRAALLYTAGPRLIEVPAAMLAAWAPDAVHPPPLQAGDIIPISAV
jgi:ATP-dependent helicase/nuclease subunit A